MPGCLAVEAAGLPRPKSQPLPSSPRRPPLHRAHIAQGFVSGDPESPAHRRHAPAAGPCPQSQPTSLARGQTTGETWERQEVPEVGQGWGEYSPSPPGFPGLGLQEGPGLGKGKGARPSPPFRRQLGQNCSLGTLGRAHPASPLLLLGCQVQKAMEDCPAPQAAPDPEGEWPRTPSLGNPWEVSQRGAKQHAAEKPLPYPSYE